MPIGRATKNFRGAIYWSPYSTNYRNHWQRHYYENGVLNNAASEATASRTICLVYTPNCDILGVPLIVANEVKIFQMNLFGGQDGSLGGGSCTPVPLPGYVSCYYKDILLAISTEMSLCLHDWTAAFALTRSCRVMSKDVFNKSDFTLQFASNQSINQSINQSNVWNENWQAASLVYHMYRTKRHNKKKLKQKKSWAETQSRLRPKCSGRRIPSHCPLVSSLAGFVVTRDVLFLSFIYWTVIYIHVYCLSVRRSM